MSILVILINNIGDAFLLVWKFPENEIFLDSNKEPTLSESSLLVNNYTVSALIAILKIIYKLKWDERIIKYSQNVKLTQRIPDYHVKMGFGLHIGWWIEGAIGSSHKIDCTYLSQHVNYASTLEELTKEYGAILVASGEFNRLLPSKAQKYFRKVDKFRHKSSKEVKEVFIIDITANKLEAVRIDSKALLKENYKTKTGKRLELLKQIKDPNYKLEIRFIEDPQLTVLFENIPEKVIRKFRKMFELYSRGCWKEAKSGLEKIVKYMNDGPSMFLLEIMRHYSFKPPVAWSGIRELN